MKGIILRKIRFHCCNTIPILPVMDHISVFRKLIVKRFRITHRPDKEEEMLRAGRIAPEHLSNRRLLRKVMQEAGFRVLPSEWWHFNLVSRAEARRRFKVID